MLSLLGCFPFFESLASLPTPSHTHFACLLPRFSASQLEMGKLYIKHPSLAKDISAASPVSPETTHSSETSISSQRSFLGRDNVLQLCTSISCGNHCTAIPHTLLEPTSFTLFADLFETSISNQIPCYFRSSSILEATAAFLRSPSPTRQTPRCLANVDVSEVSRETTHSGDGVKKV